MRRDDDAGELEQARAERLAEHDAQWPPELVGYLWSWFGDLSDWRDSSMGVGPLSHLEIECWARLMRIDPPIGPFEVDALRKLDRECRSYNHEKNKPEEKNQSIGDSLRDIAEANAAKKAAEAKAKAKARSAEQQNTKAKK